MSYEEMYFWGVGIGFGFIFIGLIIVTGIRLAVYSRAVIQHADDPDSLIIVLQFVYLGVICAALSLLWPLVIALGVLIGIPYLITLFVLWGKDQIGEPESNAG